MERWLDHVAVVTGASSGIGAAITKELLKAGLIVVGMGRRKERLDDLCAKLPSNVRSRFHGAGCDVGDVNSVNVAFDWVEQNVGGIDVMINNAGVHSPGQLLTQDVAKLQNVLQTNVMGVVHCTQRAVKSMRARNFDGHIFVVNSIIGHTIFQPPIGMLNEFNIYGPSKYAVTAMVEVLRQELRDFETKIKVTSISPGFVATEIVSQKLLMSVMLQPEDVANAVYYALATPPHIQVHELTLKPIGEKV